MGALAIRDLEAWQDEMFAAMEAVEESLAIRYKAADVFADCVPLPTCLCCHKRFVFDTDECDECGHLVVMVPAPF
jgi:hypothetical protein